MRSPFVRWCDRWGEFAAVAVTIAVLFVTIIVLLSLPKQQEFANVTATTTTPTAAVNASDFLGGEDPAVTAEAAGSAADLP